MHGLLRWSGVICLVALGGLGCARVLGSSAVRHPIPAALEWPAFDVFRSGGVSEWSLPTETAQTAKARELWTQGAVDLRDAFWQRVLRDRCAAREALQIANGDRPEADPVCRPAERVP